MMAPTNALPLPCLVFDYGGSEQPATTVYSVSDGTHRACDAEELRGKQSWPTSSGWVLVREPATSATFLWNPSPTPAGSDKVALPPMAEPPPAGSVCALSGSPVSGECTVVLSEPGESTALWYCHAGGDTSAWTRHEYDIGSVTVNAAFLDGDYTFKRRIASLVPCRRKFYYLHSPAELGVIDFSPAPAFGTVPLKEVPPHRDPGPGRWLQAFQYVVSITGELHTVSVVFHGPDVSTVVDVCVRRVDFARNELVRVDSIGDQALLLGRNIGSGGWCPATEFGLMPNSVYWMSPRDKRLHVFDIGAGTEEKVEEPCNGVAEPSRLPFWIIPVHPAA